ncbi:MAG: hypothetical protein ACT4UQ_06910 [Gammaproteobacteria bacterium]
MNGSTSWRVVIDRRDAEERMLQCYPLARARRRRAEAQGDLRRLRELYPACRMVRIEDEPAAFA